MQIPLASISLLCILAVSALAQDPQLSQFYASPIYLNPAFAGNTVQGRLVANYRNQWPSIPGAFVTQAFSFDHNLPQFNSGIAFNIMNDKAGSGGLRFTNLGFTWAAGAELARNHIIKIGLQFSHTWRNIDFHKLTFGDQLVRNDGSGTVETFPNDPIRYFDISTGLVYYSTNYWFGIAAHHIGRPHQSLVGLDTQLPMKLSVQGGYKFSKEDPAQPDKEKSYSVAFLYKAQEEWDQLDIGFYRKSTPWVIGLWYRGLPLVKAYQSGYGNSDAFVLLAGISAGDISIGYSFDLTISKLAPHSGNAHEVSLIYEFASDHRKRIDRKRRIIMPCSKF